MAADTTVEENDHSPAGSLGLAGDCDHMACVDRSLDGKTGYRNPEAVPIAAAMAAADNLLQCSLRSHSRWGADRCSSLGSTCCLFLLPTELLSSLRQSRRDEGYIDSRSWRDGN
jgi:hypothetical protein